MIINFTSIVVGNHLTVLLINMIMIKQYTQPYANPLILHWFQNLLGEQKGPSSAMDIQFSHRWWKNLVWK